MMPVYNKDSRLSEPLFHDPSLIPVYNRFGIYLGVGDMSVREACETHEVNLEFFLAVINTYLNKDYFPGNLVEEIHIDMLLDYLEKTDSYYSDVQLPNIERHFNFLLQKSVGQSAAGSSLELLRKFFFEVKEEMTLMIRNDLEYWFPLFRKDLSEARVRIGKNSMILIPYPYHFRSTMLLLRRRYRILFHFSLFISRETTTEIFLWRLFRRSTHWQRM